MYAPAFEWVLQVHVTFKSFGPLRRLIGEAVIDLEVDKESTVRQVVQRVIEEWGTEARHLILDGEKISGNLIILLNMKDVSVLGGVDIPVTENDEVAILPHVQGG
ncbi:MAG: MoaD/ThiS family protein [Candidatus Thorarchaeota archaeon]